MSSSKRMNLICAIAIVLSVLAALLLPMGGAENGRVMGYEDKLFDTARVHAIDISMNNWEEFIENCKNEEYAACDVTIDGEKFKNVAIRAKGNTSLSNVSSMNSDRYSFKVEFDHFDNSFSYHGLDKLSLNNVIQDNTFMKDYLTYRMMNEFDVPAPLASFVYITVNGEDWGMYLAVEGVEDAFLTRNYGLNHGELYKPDSMDMGGGRGNGKGFDMDAFENAFAGKNAPEDGFSFENRPDMSKGFAFGGRGSSDVKLVYSFDRFESYSNIFENAKTDLTDADKRRLISALKRMNEGDTSAVNAEDVIRYFVVHNFVVNGDSYTGTMIHNYYLYEENGALSMIPWDYNLAYGTFMGSKASDSVNNDIDQPVTGGMNDRPMIAWIFENEEYKRKYHAYFTEFLNNVDALSIIEEAEKRIAPYVEKDPSKFCTFEEFEKGVTALKTFVTLRAESVRNQLNGTGEAVDAGGLNLSDMGTMGFGRGGKGGLTASAVPTRDIGGMPLWNAGEMPSGGFPTPRKTSESSAPAGETERPNEPGRPMETEKPTSAVNGEEKTKAAEPEPKTNAVEKPNNLNWADRNRSGQTQWKPGEDWPNGMSFPTMPGANESARTSVSSEALFIASIIVLIVSIAVALIIKH